MKTQYVLMVVTNAEQDVVVGITKLKGPSFLLKKVTFPGGKMEEGETPEQAASREMLEETSLVIDPGQWQLFDTVLGEDYVLYKLAAETPKVRCARQREEEPVWILDVKPSLEFAAKQPAQYAPDFIPTLQDAMAVLTRPPLALAA